MHKVISFWIKDFWIQNIMKSSVKLAIYLKTSSWDFLLKHPDQTYLEILFWFSIFICSGEWFLCWTSCFLELWSISLSPSHHGLLYGSTQELCGSQSRFSWWQRLTKLLYQIFEYLLKLVQKSFLGTANKMKQFYHDLRSKWSCGGMWVKDKIYGFVQL